MIKSPPTQQSRSFHWRTASPNAPVKGAELERGCSWVAMSQCKLNTSLKENEFRKISAVVVIASSCGHPNLMCLATKQSPAGHFCVCSEGCLALLLLGDVLRFYFYFMCVSISLSVSLSLSPLVCVCVYVHTYA